MTTPASPGSVQIDRAEHAREACTLVRAALAGTIATVDRDDATPYASLVAVATLPDARPLLLISKLALHTRNAGADPRASLLVDRRGDLADPLTGPRVTLLGRLLPCTDPSARSRYLARHRGAEVYAGFADFGFYELEVSRAHFVGGFGRITPLQASEILQPAAAAAEVIAIEDSVIAHMNEDHAEAVALIATGLGGMAAGAWRLTGVDSLGFDLVCDSRALRLAFPQPVATADEVRRAFVALVAEARSSGSAGS